MVTLLCGLLAAACWVPAIRLRRLGFTGLRAEMAVAVTASIIYAAILAGQRRTAATLNAIHAGLGGYGIPVTHWFPQVPRALFIVGAFFTLGIALRIRSGLRRAARGEGD
jgi:hypothetical protein